MRRTVSDILRVFGDQADRTRMEPKKDKGVVLQDERRAGCLVAITGEYSPTDGTVASDVARMDTTQITKTDIDFPKLTELQTHSDMLAQAMIAHLERLAPLIPDMPDSLAKEFVERRDMAEKVGVKGRHRRLNSAIAHKYIGLKSILQSAVFYGAMTEEEMNAHLDKAWTIFNKMADRQTGMSKNNDQAQTFLESFSHLMAQNKILIRPMKVGDKSAWGEPIVNPAFQRELVGFGPDDNGIMYIMVSPLVKEINKLLGPDEQINTNSVIADLERKEMLVDTYKKDGTLNERVYKKTISQTREYVTAIRAEFFFPDDD
jgi:hypothetical protein